MLEMNLGGYRFSLGLIYMLNLLFWASEALLGHAQNCKSK